MSASGFHMAWAWTHMTSFENWALSVVWLPWAKMPRTLLSTKKRMFGCSTYMFGQGMT